jgi:hypothetical protein
MPQRLFLGQTGSRHNPWGTGDGRTAPWDTLEPRGGGSLGPTVGGPHDPWGTGYGRTDPWDTLEPRGGGSLGPTVGGPHDPWGTGYGRTDPWDRLEPRGGGSLGPTVSGPHNPWGTGYGRTDPWESVPTGPWAPYAQGGSARERALYWLDLVDRGVVRTGYAAITAILVHGGLNPVVATLLATILVDAAHDVPEQTQKLVAALIQLLTGDAREIASLVLKAAGVPSTSQEAADYLVGALGRPVSSSESSLSTWPPGGSNGAVGTAGSTGSSNSQALAETLADRAEDRFWHSGTMDVGEMTVTWHPP